MRLGPTLALFLLFAAALPGRAIGACSNSTAAAEVRALVDQQCACETAPSRHVFVSCAKAVIASAVADGRLPADCRADASRCASRSTCGRPGAVTCCRTTRTGKTKCSIKKVASQCRAPSGGGACVGTVPSCCAACGTHGECTQPTTTSSTSSTVTTTTVATTSSTSTSTSTSTTVTTTTAPPHCGNGIIEGSEQCDGADIGGATCPGGSAGGAFPTCRADCTLDASTCPGVTTSTSSTTSTSTSSTSTSSTTSTSSSTTTTIPHVACDDPLLALPPLAHIPVETVAGSATCGGAGLTPPASSPFTGQVFDASNQQIGRLGTDCFYIGGGGSPFAPEALPFGTSLVVDAKGLRGVTAILGGSDGTGPRDCTRGAGPAKHCVNGGAGLDGQGSCVGDLECGPAGACQLDANCYFTAPLDITDPIATCAVNVSLTDLCAEVNLLTLASTFRGAISSRVYFGGCPQCVAGVCQGGGSDGQTCTAGSAGTSSDCLPTPSTFFGAFMTAPTLSTGTLEMSDPNGILCAGQGSPGAFGRPDARRVRTTGEGVNLLTQQTSLAGPACILPSNNPLLDGALALPAPAAFSMRAKFDILRLLLLFGF